MTAEPRDVEGRCGFTIIGRDGWEQPCERPATGWRWYQDHDHEDTLDVACDRHENEGGRRLAAADRENAELRGEVERLRSLAGPIREGYEASEAMRRDARAERDDLRAQLAAAQAQLAEARHEHDRVGEWINHYKAEQEAIIARYMARLEAVRALRSRWEAERTYLNAEQEPIAAAYIELLDAALSAAPQPEPEVAPYETPEEAAANDAIPAEPISPEFRQRLIAAVERPLRVRRAILLLAGHASGHLPGFDRGCRVCRRDWPCEDTQRAAAPALEAFADVTPEPPASDEPTGRSD